MRHRHLVLGLIALVTACGGSTTTEQTDQVQDIPTSTGATGTTGATASESTTPASSTVPVSGTATTSDVPPASPTTGDTTPSRPALPDQVAYSCPMEQPDGSWYLGLCVLDPGSGTTNLEVSDVSPFAGATWSPDRTRVAGVCGFETWSGQDIWPMSEGLDLGLVGWARNRGGEICVADATPSGSLIITFTEGRANSPAFTPDGTGIVYAVGPGPIVAGGGTTEPRIGDPPGIHSGMASHRSNSPTVTPTTSRP